MSSAAPLRPRPESVSQRLFLLAHQGNEADLVGELDSLSEADASAALSAIVCDGEGQMMTTVIAAAKEGHHKVVQVLVDKYKSDLAQRGTVKLDMHLIQGQLDTLQPHFCVLLHDSHGSRCECALVRIRRRTPQGRIDPRRSRGRRQPDVSEK
jgi:D-arabinose 5-phosphate isomerase GutQ